MQISSLAVTISLWSAVVLSAHNTFSSAFVSTVLVQRPPPPAAQSFMSRRFPLHASDPAKGSSVTEINNNPTKQQSNDSTTTTTTKPTPGPVLSIFLQSLRALGIIEGKSLTWGVVATDVDPQHRVSPDEAVRRRNDAARDLVNINDNERQRRKQLGTIFAVVSAVYIVWAALWADQGGPGGHVWRFLAILPVFLAYSSKRSAQLGLCTIGYDGMWDVDGNGLSKIDDPQIAQAILDKLNEFLLSTLTRVGLAVTGFALLPQSVSAPLVMVAVVLASLYYLRGKIPETVE